MSTNEAGKSNAGRIVGLCVAVAFALLAVLVFIQRQRYPDGTFLVQERTWYEERLNQDIGETLDALVPGETTTAELLEKLGEPLAKVEKDGLEVWVYQTRTVKKSERRLSKLSFPSLGCLR